MENAVRIEIWAQGPATAKVISEFVVAFAKARAEDDAVGIAETSGASGVSADMAAEKEVPGVKSASGENTAASAAEEKPKRRPGRPRKADKAKEEAKAEKAEQPALAPEPEIVVEPETAPNEINDIQDLVGDVIAPVTEDDVKSAMGALGQAKGLQSVANVFAEFGNKKLSDFSEDQYPELVDKLKEAAG